MIIKTGLLHIPELDEQASESIRSLFSRSVSGSLIMIERTVGSQRNWIEEILRQWSDEEELDCILTIGGCYPASGPSAEEIVPEATFSVIERQLPGLTESMRAVAQEETPLALLDRGIAGIRGRTLIINLPGGQYASLFFLDAIVELIEPVCQHLQGFMGAPTIEDDLSPSDVASMDRKNKTLRSDNSSTGLNAEEFAAFLRRDEK